METRSQFDFETLDFKAELKKCKTIKDLMGKDGLIKQIMKEAIETMLQAELDEHLGYAKHESAERAYGNTRNGTTSKNIRTSAGMLPLEIPRDRSASFEPQVVKKHQRDISEFDEKIISMYARGMTTRDIQDHVLDIYGAEISPAMVSLITDKVEGKAREWQSRVLDAVYAIVYFDAIHYKVRENGKIIMKAAYTCLAIDLEGKKHLLGIWIGEHEGAHFWATVFSELRARGVLDILIACVDGLKGLPDALHSIFPKTEVQLCVVHMIRNSLKFIGYKNVTPFLVDLKTVYTAPSKLEAEKALKDFSEKWATMHPLAVKPWIVHWDNVSAFFQYPPDLRKIIYTTNAVEGVHRQFRKVTKNRSVMPNDDALFKILFLAGENVQKKWVLPVRNWSSIISSLHLHFRERIIMS